MKNAIISSIGAAVLSLSSVGIVTSASAETEWRMSTTHADTRLEIAWYEKWIDRVEELSEGDLKIKFFTGGSLGVKDVDLLRALPKGNIMQIATAAPTWFSRDEPAFQGVLPTGVLDEPGQVAEIKDTLWNIYDEFYDDWGIKLVTFTGHPASEGMIYCREPIRTLEELSSKKVRVWEKFHIDTLTNLGIASQIMPQSELYLALSTGVVDCTIYAPAWANGISIHEVAPYGAYLFPLVLPPFQFIVSEDAYNELTPRAKAAIEQASEEIWAETSSAWINGDYDKGENEKFVNNGGEILEPFSEEDRAAWAQAARTAWVTLAEAAGQEAIDARARVLEAVEASSN